MKLLKSKYYNYSVLFVFILVIFIFFINQIISIIPDRKYNENKKKADFPALTFSNIENFPKQFDNYLNDNFSLRGYFLKYMGIINLSFWKKSPKQDKLLLGKENWLYNVDKELDYYLGKKNIPYEQMVRIINELRHRKKVLDSLGIEMAFVINPTKYSVYPEYLPSIIENESGNNNTEWFIKTLTDSTDITVIYTKNFLLPHKKDYLLYYKGDNHWNEIAGYYAAAGILKSLNTTKDIPVIPFSEFCIDTNHNYIGNLANMAADAERFAEDEYELRLCKNDAKEHYRYKYPVIKGFPYPWEYQRSFESVNDSLPDILIIRDSFGNACIPYIKNRAHYSTFIFDAWRYGFNYEIIKKEKPALVIFMVLESLLPGFKEKAD